MGETFGRERKEKQREKENWVREKIGDRRGGEEEERKTVEERTEGEISCFKQVLSVIYICLQNEKCVP